MSQLKKYQTVVIDIDNTLTSLQFVVDKIADLHQKERIHESEIDNFRLAFPFKLTEAEESSFWKDHEHVLVSEAIVSTERVSRILNGYTNENTQIHLISNRPPALQEITEEWVTKQKLPYTTISCIGKQSKLDWLLKEHPETEAVFEDNPDFFYEVWDAGLFSKIDTYCIDYLYNQEVPCKYRLGNVNGMEMVSSERRLFP